MQSSALIENMHIVLIIRWVQLAATDLTFRDLIA